MDHSVNILMFDNSNHILTSLECKDHAKYLGVLLDSHLSWKYHIDNVALKISRIIGVIARLWHLVPFTTVLSISQPRAHAVPLFTSSKILSLNMLHVETVSSIMLDVSCLTVPTNISNLFTKEKEKHNHETRFSSSCNFYIN